MYAAGAYGDATDASYNTNPKWEGCSARVSAKWDFAVVLDTNVGRWCPTPDSAGVQVDVFVPAFELAGLDAHWQCDFITIVPLGAPESWYAMKDDGYSSYYDTCPTTSHSRIRTYRYIGAVGGGPATTGVCGRVDKGGAIANHAVFGCVPPGKHEIRLYRRPSWDKPAWRRELTIGPRATTTKLAFGAAFRRQEAGGDAIIRRECADCTASHRDVYFKRKAGSSNFDAYTNMLVTWSDHNNKMGTDFNIYASLNDALQGRNPWKYCDYNDPGIGFPRDCGPNEKSEEDGNHEWNSLTDSRGQDSVRFSVYEPHGTQHAPAPNTKQPGTRTQLLRFCCGA